MSTKINYMGVWDEKSKRWLKASGTVKQGRRPMYQPNAQGHTPSQVLHASLLEAHGEALNELDNLKHDYAIVSAQRNDLLAACKAALTRLERLDDAGTGEYSPAYLQVQAAIAKAEGR